MRHACGFNDLRIQASELRFVLLLSAQFLRQPPANLSDLDSVLLARVENAALTSSHDLCDTG
jgi:hypothetical protein